MPENSSPKNNKDSSIITLRCAPEFKTRVLEFAKSKGLDTSSFTRLALVEYMDASQPVSADRKSG